MRWWLLRCGVGDEARLSSARSGANGLYGFHGGSWCGPILPTIDAADQRPRVDPEGERAESTCCSRGGAKRDPAPATSSLTSISTRSSACLTGYEDYPQTAVLDTFEVGILVIYRHQALDHASLESLTGAGRFAGMIETSATGSKRRPTAGDRRRSQAWGLEAAASITERCSSLPRRFGRPLSRRCVHGVLRYLDAHTRSSRFSAGENIVAVTAELAQVRYTINIHGTKVTVAATKTRLTSSEEVLATFERFSARGGGLGLCRGPQTGITVNHVEARVLDRVAEAFPDQFMCLDRFWDEWRISSTPQSLASTGRWSRPVVL